ncbi:MAG: YchJ family protein [Chlamydiales bacterium]
MEHEPLQPCPCCSGKTYRNCCESYHKGCNPPDALALMRSRYSAYALNLPDYIIATTHPSNEHYCSEQEHWKNTISQFSIHTNFEKLEVQSFIRGDSVAFVTFTARLKQNLRDASFTEKSRFEIHDGKWLYHSAVSLT